MSLLGHQLEAFLAITKTKTVHSAADVLFLTQTAVTQRIRALERQLKTTLFIRTRRGMQLTSEGESLLRYCHAAKALEGETLARIQGAGLETDIQLTITAPTSMMQARILPACLEVMRAFPRLLLNLKSEDAENRHEQLRRGECDLAVIESQHQAAEMQTKALKPETYILVCSPAWKGRSLKKIISEERIIDFDENDTVTFDYLKHHDLFDLVNPARYFANRTENIARMVQAGIGYSALDKAFAAPRIRQGELLLLNSGKSYHVTPLLAWYQRPEPPRYFSALLDALV